MAADDAKLMASVLTAVVLAAALLAPAPDQFRWARCETQVWEWWRDAGVPKSANFMKLCWSAQKEISFDGTLKHG